MGLFKPKLRSDIQDRIKEIDPRVFVSIPHVNGLPIAENTLCQIYYTDDNLFIDGSGQSFNLSNEKISAIEIKTDVEIQKQYVSSVAGGITGAIVFGPLGALIGGRVKEKKIKNTTRYLIITYTSDNEIKYLGFDITYTPKALEIIKLFNKNNLNKNIIEL
ncbi:MULTISPECIES: hypothetical protein [Clostridium]|uniref:hypothetical protein n=1 Tax=Clostridium TaxID=1485 RepID=UPI0013D464EA|nr:MULTISPECIES: hypothetical protein [Clostridium]MBN1042511.1 hypothetical protein [Clostridium botulinum]MCQ2017292.1 hypothetical protein [Clostridium butyricum]NFB72521.1 hypothetical protein [Clostridium butyricum]NFB91554.1 hypothetical protein [Clostridium butyricum]UTY53571.1 hypothetical protein HNS01_10880 [Clostridium butyricum]